MGKPDVKQKACPTYHLVSIICQFHCGWVQSGEQEPGLLRHLSPKVATSPFQLSVSPLVNSIQLSITSSPSRCHTCINRKFSIKCTNAYGTQIQSLLVSERVAGAAHKGKGEHGGRTPSQQHLPTFLNTLLRSSHCSSALRTLSIT